MKIQKFVATMAVLALVLTGCAPLNQDGGSADSENLKVVTTIAPLYSLASNLVVDTPTEVTNLLPSNVDVHSFQLTPDSAKLLAEADLVVINGVELEEFLEDATEDMTDKVVETAKDVPLLKFREDHGEGYDEHEGEEHEDEEENEHGEFDPHVWLDPQNALLQSREIEDALIKADPANAETYRANGDKLEEKINALDAEIKARLSKLDIKPYIVFHDAYQYFEKAFGVQAVASLEGYTGQDPSAEYLKEIVDIIKEKNVEVLFTEPQFSPKLFEILSKDYSLKKAELTPEGTVATFDSYFDMMLKNVEAFESMFNEKEATRG